MGSDMDIMSAVGKVLNIFDFVDGLKYDGDTKVVYSGVPGAFAEMALVEFFGEDVIKVPVSSFREVMEALSNDEAVYGVLPIENSSAGNVESNYDLLAEYDLYIVGEQIIEVNQALMVLPEALLEDIKTVYSHPQGLMQCSKYLEEHNWNQISMSNTARSAMKVRDDKDITAAAIASERSAKLYGLKIINPVANNNTNNATRFIVLSKKPHITAEANKVAISFALPHESGALYKILGDIVNHGLNMTMIESRPIPGKQWEYYFYIEFIGRLSDDAVKLALLEIGFHSIDLRILGNYLTH